MSFNQIILFLIVPPDILDEGSSSDVVVREGANVTLTCKAVGYPTPNITWRREDNEPIPLGAWQGKKVTGNTFYAKDICKVIDYTFKFLFTETLKINWTRKLMKSEHAMKGNNIAPQYS